MTAVDIRVATLNDLDAVAKLFDAYRQFYGQAPDLPMATSFIQSRMAAQESVVFIAEAGNQSCGFCQLYPTFCSVEAKPIVVLYDLFVVEDARRSGAGELLLGAAEAFARREGYSRMDLTTAKDNHVAQHLYERMGWKRDEVFFAYNKPLIS